MYVFQMFTMKDFQTSFHNESGIYTQPREFPSRSLDLMIGLYPMGCGPAVSLHTNARFNTQ